MCFLDVEILGKCGPGCDGVILGICGSGCHV